MPRKKKVIDEKHIMSLKVVGLKKLCTRYKLTKKGRKAILQDRILEHLQLGKYATEALPIEEPEPEQANLTAPKPEELKVQEKKQQQAEVNLVEVENKGAGQLKAARELKDHLGSEKKLSIGEVNLATSMGEEANRISEVEMAAKKVEKEVETAQEFMDARKDVLQTHDNITERNKRTSSDANISNDDITTVKKRKVAKKIETKEPNEESVAGLLEEQSFVARKELELEQKSRERGSNESKTKILSEIKSIPKDQNLASDEVELPYEPEHGNVPREENLVEKVDEAFSKDLKSEKEAEESVTTLEFKKQDDEKVPEAIPIASESEIEIDAPISKSDMKIDFHASKVVQSNDETFSKDFISERKAEETVTTAEPKIQVDETVSEVIAEASESEMQMNVPLVLDPPSPLISRAKQEEEFVSKSVNSKNQTEVISKTGKKKNILPQQKPISNIHKKKNRTDKSVGSDGRASKSNLGKKTGKRKETNSERGYQHRGDQRRQDQNRNRNRNRENWNNRNRSRNSNYRTGYRQPRNNFFYNNPRINNSIPFSQQQRRWDSQDGYQAHRSFYLGGYGNDRRRSGEERSWVRPPRGGWRERDRQNALLRNSRRGGGGRR